jgi:hypothetical protein
MHLVATHLTRWLSTWDVVNCSIFFFLFFSLVVNKIKIFLVMGTDALLSFCTNMTIYLECWASSQISISKFSDQYWQVLWNKQILWQFEVKARGSQFCQKNTKFILPDKTVSLVSSSRLLIMEILSALLFSEMLQFLKFFGVGGDFLHNLVPDRQDGKFVQFKCFLVGDF